MVQHRAILTTADQQKVVSMIYRTAPFSVTLNDAYPRFHGHSIFWRWLSQKWYIRDTDSFNGILIIILTHALRWYEASRGLSATAKLLVELIRACGDISNGSRAIALTNKETAAPTNKDSGTRGDRLNVSLWVSFCLSTR